ncbi:MAG: rRNA methyltransferase, partial [Actinomycetota bacterium]
MTAVSDVADPRLADYAGLTDARLRRSLEAEHGLFIAESERVIRRAIAAGFGVRSMLVTSDRLTALADLVDTCPGPVHVMDPADAAALTGFQL